MPRCEDFPCCGHYDESDGSSWCPSDEGIFPCSNCWSTDPEYASSRSSICLRCQSDPATFHDPDCPGCPYCDDTISDGEEPRYCENCSNPIDPDDFGCTNCDEDEDRGDLHDNYLED